MQAGGDQNAEKARGGGLASSHGGNLAVTSREPGYQARKIYPHARKRLSAGAVGDETPRINYRINYRYPSGIENTAAVITASSRVRRVAGSPGAKIPPVESRREQSAKNQRAENRKTNELSIA